ncbi:hypothetical protein N7486_010747 [Penicillium sp. IBT 16267x]|nr:hypothetical protein N7486_010747 [Penicillium sp. IBT 16267x]
MAKLHAETKHRDKSPPKPSRNSEGVACPHAEEFNCKKLFTCTSSANRHAKDKHGKEIFDCSECKEVFADRSSVDRHKKTQHSDNGDKGTPEDHYCPRAIDERCTKVFPSKRAARDHSIKKHGKAGPDETFVVAWPMISQHIFVKDVFGERITWEKVPKPPFLGGKFVCPDPECSFTKPDIFDVKIHYVGNNLGGAGLADTVHFPKVRSKFGSFYLTEADIEELRDLFVKAASQQWLPMTEIAAKATKRMHTNGGTDITASEIANIDLEFGFSKRVLQIGLADLKGDNVLNYHTTYSKGVAASLPKRLVPPTRQQLRYEKMVRDSISQDGTLSADQVVGKLRENGISQNTIFLSWATWCFDVSHLRDWLEAEGFHFVLPGNENVCLILLEFRRNLGKFLGKACFRGRCFPLTLPVVFPVLVGVDQPLAWRNHHALVDAKQLVLMVKLYVDLCRSPDERVFWPTLDIAKLGPRKRQGQLEEYFTPSKKPRLSNGDE